MIFCVTELNIFQVIFKSNFKTLCYCVVLTYNLKAYGQLYHLYFLYRSSGADSAIGRRWGSLRQWVFWILLLIYIYNLKFRPSVTEEKLEKSENLEEKYVFPTSIASLSPFKIKAHSIFTLSKISIEHSLFYHNKTRIQFTVMSFSTWHLDSKVQVHYVIRIIIARPLNWRARR